MGILILFWALLFRKSALLIRFLPLLFRFFGASANVNSALNIAAESTERYDYSYLAPG